MHIELVLFINQFTHSLMILITGFIQEKALLTKNTALEIHIILVKKKLIKNFVLTLISNLGNPVGPHF